MQQYVLKYVQVVLGGECPSLFFFFGGVKFMHAQYIDMFVLDSTRQKLDV